MGERVIVTGGCGLIGRSVVAELQKRGHQVTVLDNLSKEDARVPDGADFQLIDLRDPGETAEAFADHDACINLAALIGGIGFFHRYPADILADNDRIYGSTFAAAARLGMRRMVFVSSSMVYESASHFPTAEGDIQRMPPPVSAYGFSKLAGEYYCRAFREQHGLHYTIIRPFNAYGPDEAAGHEIGAAHVIPDLIRKILEGQDPLEILGDGSQTRCFTHVRDIARGIVMALESPQAEDEDFNLSSDVETRILDLAGTIWELCRPGTPLRVQSVPSFQYDVQRRVPEVSKAARLMNWGAEIALREGLEEVVRWQRERAA
jgi:UDP-glucose 4-epimerase